MASNKLIWFPFYPADFITSESVLLLSNAEVGVYIKLLCHQWIEGTIPLDREAVFHIAGVNIGEHKDSEYLWTVVQRLFNGRSTDGQRMFNERLESVRSDSLATASRKQESARLAGLASAESRKKSYSTNDLQKLTAVQRSFNGRSTSVNHTQAQLQSQLKQIHSTGPLPRAGKRVVSYTQDFERFWDEYPRQWCGAKAEAFREFGQIKMNGFSLEDLLVVLRAQIKNYEQVTARGEFCERLPHACRWIKRRMWETLPAPPTAGTGNKSSIYPELGS